MGKSVVSYDRSFAWLCISLQLCYHAGMKNFNLFPAESARALRYILFDIDDTITTDGRLTAEAYGALWALHKHGLVLIPVTGRPAGWCDMIIRQWPVDAVIGENGAFAYYRPRGENMNHPCDESTSGYAERIHLHNGHTPGCAERIRPHNGHTSGYFELTHPQVCADAQARLAVIRDACLAQVPGARVARDQFARRYDLAIDFCEDEPRLGLDAAYAIRDICTSFGAMAKVSSIHVNTWFGEYDKLSMADMLLTQVFGEASTSCGEAQLYAARERACTVEEQAQTIRAGAHASYLQKSIFFGDSPNDEPMFGYFTHSCAVANILPFLGKLQDKPAYVTEHESGQGFAQAVLHLLLLITQ